MGSNFYRSALKKAFLEAAPRAGFAALSFDNSGAGRATETERFLDCLPDLDALADFAARRGHPSLVLVGHSTGCQKITYWQSRRQSPAVAALVLLAPADDYAVTRRDLGPRRFAAAVARARRLEATKDDTARIKNGYESFSPRRFLSVADPRRPEAATFRYDGPLTAFRRLRCPVLAAFGAEEEFAAIPPASMLSILARRARTPSFTPWLVPFAGHSFRGVELPLARAICQWAAGSAGFQPAKKFLPESAP
jgi:pimeloyl-ACP methyl ester carboxylesterase